MFSKKPEHPVISLNALVGFCEDNDAAKRFTRRFLPVILGCIATFIGFSVSVAIPLLSFVQKPGSETPSHIFYVWLAIASFVGFFTILFLGWRRMVHAIPVSPRSGQPMEVYQSADTMTAGHLELIYVCRQSRTYFRMVFKTPG